MNIEHYTIVYVMIVLNDEGLYIYIGHYYDKNLAKTVLNNNFKNYLFKDIYPLEITIAKDTYLPDILTLVWKLNNA